ncbi:MAG: DNA-directed RNA polymerase subunit K [Candidatus Aenigmatarchaeota archaeon]
MFPKDRLTRFEVARIISARALQIEFGAPCFVSITGNSIEKAKEEFRKKLIPLTVRRRLPNGEVVEIDLDKAIDNWLKEHGDV